MRNRYDLYYCKTMREKKESRKKHRASYYRKNQINRMTRVTSSSSPYRPPFILPVMHRGFIGIRWVCLKKSRKFPHEPEIETREMRHRLVLILIRPSFAFTIMPHKVSLSLVMTSLLTML